ncbi:12414_t:CDS:1, partial [Dentiscutata erythropus]
SHRMKSGSSIHKKKLIEGEGSYEIMQRHVPNNAQASLPYERTMKINSIG